MIGLVQKVASLIEFLSVSIITWGVLWALFRLLFIGIEKHRVDLDLSYSWLRVRRTLGEIMLLGLQFLVAADIILTVCNPDVKQVVLLSVVVTIRVVLSISLGHEIMGLEKRDMKAKRHLPPHYE
ncbi:MAG: DUF1622 domain-containing protein [Pyramidobacter sp.]|jgi:uncharacterized membrane protein